MNSNETNGMTLMGGIAAVAAAQTDSAAVEKALETLKTYDWGSDREALKPIDQAIIATHGDAVARKALEKSRRTYQRYLTICTGLCVP